MHSCLRKLHADALLRNQWVQTVAVPQNANIVHTTRHQHVFWCHRHAWPFCCNTCLGVDAICADQDVALPALPGLHHSPHPSAAHVINLEDGTESYTKDVHS